MVMMLEMIIQKIVIQKIVIQKVIVIQMIIIVIVIVIVIIEFELEEEEEDFIDDFQDVDRGVYSDYELQVDEEDKCEDGVIVMLRMKVTNKKINLIKIKMIIKKIKSVEFIGIYRIISLSLLMQKQYVYYYDVNVCMNVNQNVMETMNVNQNELDYLTSNLILNENDFYVISDSYLKYYLKSLIKMKKMIMLMIEIIKNMNLNLSLNKKEI
ncbi:MAG: hypothetical protein EZS28_022479 [Streblomastix strix]|uniref:Uncharacterized protein n=1 Tax=Streblomastix strix TaxID=222440 RepID=A0A5J4VHR9_9EUKA|nr:MAG: hypothetical protein EZS28_022479 [Streblomastix strix]